MSYTCVWCRSEKEDIDVESTDKVVIKHAEKTIDIGSGQAVYIGSLGQAEKEVKSSWMVYTGSGLVWTMDWSPHDEEDEASFLAIGCHAPGDEAHDLHTTYSGTHAIQIWKFSDACIDPEKNDTNMAPTKVMNLVHDGGPTWALCWCPSRGAKTRERIGLLAAVLGDGSIRIWSIPRNNGEPVSCRVEPVAFLGKDHVDGSIPCTLDWLPHAPHDLLLVGYRDGCVSIIQMMDCMEENVRVIQYFPAEVLALTSVKWFPKQRDACSVNGLERHVFVTSGQEGVINIWDSRLEYSPRVTVRSNTAYTIQDMCWTTAPLGITMAMEDGTIRGYLMDAAAVKNQLPGGRPTLLIAYRGKLPGAMCTVDASVPSTFSGRACQTIAYAGEDGIVGIQGNPKYPYVSRKRKGLDIPLAGLWAEGDGQFKLLSSEELMLWEKQGGLFHGPAEDRKKALHKTHGKLTDISQAIYSLKWSHRPETCDEKTHGQWLAYGNVQGIVHCLWIPSYHST